jgi:hypothetical protein
LWLTEPLVGRALAELALVQDVIGGEQRSAERPVELVGGAAGPAGIGDAALVDDDGDVPPPSEPQQWAQVARQPRRAEVEDCEVGRAVRETRSEPLELRRAAGDRLTGRRHAVVAVEDPEP